MSMLNVGSLLGLVVLAALAWLAGGAKRPVPWRTVLGSGGLMLVMALIIFLVPPTRVALVALNDAVIALLAAGAEGTRFLFGPLALNPGETGPNGEQSVGFILAVQVLPALVFFAALMALLYHLRLLQLVIRLFAWIFHKTLSLSGAESLAGASNIFVGVESCLTVRPYLAQMTRSELLMLITCGMSTVASTTLALYVLFLKDGFPLIAGHLISASVLSIPAAAMVSKLLLPEDGSPETMGSVPPIDEGERQPNAMAALAHGGFEGLKLAAGVATLLIAVLGIVALIDLILGPTGLSLDKILGWIFTPVAFLLGIESADLMEAARLLGARIVMTEVVAYQRLGELAASGALSSRSLLVMSYALCGFAHVASVAIFVGGVSAIVPERRGEIGALGPRALLGATLATLMTGALAGLCYHGQAGLLGLG